MHENIVVIDSLNISLNLKEITKELNIAEDDIAFLAGSLIEPLVNKTSRNMGNRLSDIDVFIITNSIEHYDATSSDMVDELSKTLFREIQGINFDIEIYDEKTILNLITQLNSYDSNNINIKTFNVIRMPSEIPLDIFTSLLHRLINSIPLNNNERYYNFKSLIDLDQYYKFMTRLSINIVENTYDDIIGNLESKEYKVSLILARSMLLESIGAYIFYNKESVDRIKWYVLKFKNIAENNSYINKLYNKFLELNFLTMIKDDKDYKKNVEDIIKFSNKLISEISNNNSL